MSDDALHPEDLLLLERMSNGNTWLRSVLCTLARRGTQMRQQEPARATELIRRLGPWPWFKGGQFLFDLLEWEDFMVDGPAPPPLTTVLQAENWQRLDDLLASIRALLDGLPDETHVGGWMSFRPPPGVSVSLVSQGRPADQALPALEPGLHLYRDVVLGIWSSLDAPGEQSPAAPA